MIAPSFCNIIQQGVNWNKPTIFLTKPFHESLKLRINSAIIKASPKMGIHNTGAVFVL